MYIYIHSYIHTYMRTYIRHANPDKDLNQKLRWKQGKHFSSDDKMVPGHGGNSTFETRFAHYELLSHTNINGTWCPQERNISMSVAACTVYRIG